MKLIFFANFLLLFGEWVQVLCLHEDEEPLYEIDMIYPISQPDSDLLA
jgi:hypothetical protein